MIKVHIAKYILNFQYCVGASPLKTYVKVYACQTNEDRFWTLVVYTAEQAKSYPSKPITKTI